MHAAGPGCHLHLFKCNATHTLEEFYQFSSLENNQLCHYASIIPQQGRKFQYCDIRINGCFFYEKGAVVGFDDENVMSSLPEHSVR